MVVLSVHVVVVFCHRPVVGGWLQYGRASPQLSVPGGQGPEGFVHGQLSLYQSCHRWCFDVCLLKEFKVWVVGLYDASNVLYFCPDPSYVNGD